MYSMTPRLAVACIAAALIAASTASAQPQKRYQVQSLNFYLWCQDTARLPQAQCDQRRPEDVKRFEDYRAIIERYEIPYLQEKESQAQLNRILLHPDPVGNPVSKNPQAQAQQPQETRTQSNPP